MAVAYNFNGFSYVQVTLQSIKNIIENWLEMHIVCEKCDYKIRTSDLNI